MMSFINTYIIKNFTVVHIHSDERGVSYYVLQVSRDKKSLQIKEQKSFSDFTILSQYLKKTIPVILCFTEKKIISKSVEKHANYLDKVLFNKNPDDFYISEMEKEEHILLSVVRKNEIDIVLKKFNTKNISICNFSVGPYILETVRELLPGREKLHTDYLIYDFESSTIESVEQEESNPMDEEISIGEDVIGANYMVAFAGCINHLSGGMARTNFELQTSRMTEESSYKRMFRIAGIFTLATFFILLTLSFAVQSIFSTKSATIQEELGLVNLQLNKIRTLKKDKVYKQSIISNSSLATSEYLSFYISEIAAKTPEDILLESLDLFPLSEKINEDEKIEITPRVFVIKGVTSSKYSVYKWLELLETFQWVRKTEIANYVFFKGEYQFTINLFL